MVDRQSDTDEELGWMNDEEETITVESCPERETESDFDHFKKQTLIKF